MSLRLLCIVVAQLVFAGSGLHADEGARIIPKKINDHLYVLYAGVEQGSNVGVVISDEGILLIDAMMAGANQDLLASIREISKKPIRFVINTHADFDHTGGNKFFADMGATIITQDNVRYSDTFNQLTFEDRLTLTFGEEVIDARHFIAHSFTDAVIHLPESNAIFMGDTYGSSWHPTFYAGGVGNHFRALDAALALADDKTIIVPGHSLVKDKRSLQRFRDNIGAWLARVGELYRDGKTADQIFNDEVIQRFRREFMDEDYGIDIPDANFMRFIERTIATELVNPYPMTKEDLRAYTGRFRFDDGAVSETAIIDGRLILRQLGSDVIEIIPLSSTRFHMRGSFDEPIEFERDKSGAVTRMIMVTDGEKETATKIR